MLLVVFRAGRQELHVRRDAGRGVDPAGGASLRPRRARPPRSVRRPRAPELGGLVGERLVACDLGTGANSSSRALLRVRGVRMYTDPPGRSAASVLFGARRSRARARRSRFPRKIRLHQLFLKYLVLGAEALSRGEGEESRTREGRAQAAAESSCGASAWVFVCFLPSRRKLFFLRRAPGLGGCAAVTSRVSAEERWSRSRESTARCTSDAVERAIEESCACSAYVDRARASDAAACRQQKTHTRVVSHSRVRARPSSERESERETTRYSSSAVAREKRERERERDDVHRTRDYD